MAGRRSTFVFLFAFLAAFVPVASGTTSSVYQDVIEQCAEEIAACAADSECLTCLSSYNNIPDTCSNTSSTSTDACEISGEVICCTFEESQDCLDSDLLIDVADCGLAISGCSSNDMACLAEFASSTTNSVGPDDDTVSTSMDDDPNAESTNGAYLASSSAFFVCTSAAVAGVLASAIGLIA